MPGSQEFSTTPNSNGYHFGGKVRNYNTLLTVNGYLIPDPYQRCFLVFGPHIYRKCPWSSPPRICSQIRISGSYYAGPKLSGLCRSLFAVAGESLPVWANSFILPFIFFYLSGKPLHCCEKSLDRKDWVPSLLVRAIKPIYGVMLQAHDNDGPAWIWFSCSK